VSTQTKTTRISVANEVLRSFASDTEIQFVPYNGIYIQWLSGAKVHRKRWQVHPGQSFYPVWNNKWCHGGTACTALSQLVRWIQNRPVLPLASWIYWSSDKIALLDPSVVAILAESGYPVSVKCVLCGHALDSGFDWWHLNKKSGPCCALSNGCRQKHS